MACSDFESIIAKGYPISALLERRFDCCAHAAQAATPVLGFVSFKITERPHTCCVVARFSLDGQDDESDEDVQEQLRREWGTVSVENDQNDYEVDTAELQDKVRMCTPTASYAIFHPMTMYVAYTAAVVVHTCVYMRFCIFSGQP